MNNIVKSEEMWIPNYNYIQDHMYILLTSLNLGGAEKIVSDQLWANYYSEYSKKVTLIVIYNKEKEHSIPKNVNVVRLNGDIRNGEFIFNQIAYENKPLVCHLINDIYANYLFSKNLHIHLVIHNDKRSWNNSIEILNHPQIIALSAVCQYVKKQLQEITQKHIYTFRHHVNNNALFFNYNKRQELRTELGISEDTILIGMTGRISHQKNYFLALDVIYSLITQYPEKKFKLIILGGFLDRLKYLYIKLINKINLLNLHNHVILPGFKNDSYNWINTFDIALNTSYFEGLSIATQEFMQNGLQVVLSDVCGQKEILDQKKQLHFFDLPEILDNFDTENFHLKLNSDFMMENQKIKFNQYKNLVISICQLITENIQERLSFDQNDLALFNKLAYGSHCSWNLLNSIHPVKEIKENKTAFLTGDLMLGGAQRSLVNLMVNLKKKGYETPLILLRQSNQTQFYNEILTNQITHYLCHTSKNTFDICANLFKYIQDNNITKVVLWNVDIKIKLLLDKFLGQYIEIVDVSPGDYAFVIMNNEEVFQESIYYYKEDFYNNLYAFVSKYNDKDSSFKLNELANKTHIIPNGVPLNIEHILLPKTNENFKLLVCGRIAPSKHLEIIFAAFSKFNKLYPHTILDVYGCAEKYNTDYYNMLIEDHKELILNKKINLKGHHDNPQSIMKDYHTLIVLGTHQGSPNTVLEAAACKLPVIANDSGGTKEIINENTGILLDTIPQVESLYNAMIDTYENYEKSIEKAQNCFDLIEKQFSMEKMATRYIKVLFNE